MADSSGELSSSTRHRNTAHSFDVDGSADPPGFDGVARVQRITRTPSQTLAVSYFDTPNLDLAMHHLLLGRRADGTEDGWHLTLPGGPDGHIDIRTPTNIQCRDKVPADLLDVVLAIVRDRPLAPVSRVTTHRSEETLHDHNGIALAVFTDDRITASTDGNERHWREWNLTLTAAGAAEADLQNRLDKRLSAAGGVPSDLPSMVARRVPFIAKTANDSRHSVRDALAQQYEKLLVWDRAVRADAPDSVHQMRVSTRTIRSLLQASGPRTDAWICDELQQLAAVLGTARDAEVLAERYQRALADLPAELVRGPVCERLIGGARNGYRSGRRDSLQMMRSERYFRLLAALESRTVVRPNTKGRKRHPKNTRLRAGYKRVRDRVKAAAETDPRHRDEALHAIRKTAKRLRYVAAATGAETVAVAAANIQTVLGDHHDSVVSRTHLIDCADGAHAAAEDTFTYGLLHRGETEISQACEIELPRVLQALDKSIRNAR